MEGTSEELQEDQAVMTRDAPESSEEARHSRMQLANAPTLAAKAARAAPLGQEDRGQEFPNSPDFSGSDGLQFSGWIAQH